MIEFTGYLTGNALKCFYKRFARFFQVCSAALCSMALPAFIFLFGSVTRVLVILVVFLLTFVIYAITIPYLLVQWDKRLMQLDKKSNVPKRIYIQENTVVYVSNQTTESRKIETVKQVQDYGEYYVLTFSASGFYSPNFVCQKDLLTKGTIEEFESLFEGKIVDKAIRGRFSDCD